MILPRIAEGEKQVEEFLAQALKFQPLIAVLVGVASGAWVLHRHRTRRENDPRIQFRVSVRFVGHEGKHWVAELLATVANKGEIPHRMTGLTMDLRGFADGDSMETASDRYRGQLPFAHALVPPNGGTISMMPEAKDNKVHVYPGTTMRYAYVTSIPDNMRFVLIHGTLEREGAEPLRADRVVRVPNSNQRSVKQAT